VEDRYEARRRRREKGPKRLVLADGGQHPPDIVLKRRAGAHADGPSARGPHEFPRLGAPSARQLCRTRELVEVGGRDERAVTRKSGEAVLNVAGVRDLGELAVRDDVDADPLLTFNLDLDCLADDGIKQLV
jgi:hypothetical protein